MKRNSSQREDTSLRPSTSRSSSRPLLNSQTSFRFPNSESNSGPGRHTQLAITQANFQAGRFSAFAAVANQLGPYSVPLNNMRTWNGCLPQMYGHLSISSRKMPPVARNPMIQYPRLFSWGNPASCGRFPGTAQRFQESSVARNFASSCPRRNSSPWVSHSGKQTKRIFMKRQWKTLPEATTFSPDDFKFSVVSYNVLSDKLLFENQYLYEDCSKEILCWDFRKENLLKELLDYNADVLCLQEVDAGHYKDWFEPRLGEAGYTGVYNQRTGGKPDGCVTFYRNSKFTLVDKKLVKYYTSNVPVLDKDNVGVVVLLQANIPQFKAQNSNDNKESRMLCIVNTHLLFNKKRGDIKLAQLAYLFAEVHSLAMVSRDNSSGVYCPVILCGDLNSLPYSPLHHFLIKGHLDYSSRSPAVISGQLFPSESTAGPSARRMTAPLLPWHFGITMDCQWRTSEHLRRQDNKDDPKEERNVEREEHEKRTYLALPFHFESVYKHHFEDGTPEVTTCHSKACCNVDYIFYTVGIRQKMSRTNSACAQKGTLTLLGKLELLRKTDFNLIKQLPNHQFSSDHISLHALFKLS